jgi:hypothetical protein
MRFRGKVALISGAGNGTGQATAPMIGAEWDGVAGSGPRPNCCSRSSPE